MGRLRFAVDASQASNRHIGAQSREAPVVQNKTNTTLCEVRHASQPRAPAVHALSIQRGDLLLSLNEGTLERSETLSTLRKCHTPEQRTKWTGPPACVRSLFRCSANCGRTPRGPTARPNCRCWA